MAEEKMRGFEGERHDPYRPGGATADFSPKQGGERQFEIGKDEAWTANMKRLHDEFMQESLEELRRRRSQFDESFTRSRDHSQELNNVALQALQNAVSQANMTAIQAIRHSENTTESANMVGKQAVRHSDVAIDRQWNIDEMAYLLTKNEVFTEAVAGAVAKAVQPVVETAMARMAKP